MYIYAYIYIYIYMLYVYVYVKNERKRETNTIFTLLEIFAGAKNCCLCYLVLAYFCFVS